MSAAGRRSGKLKIGAALCMLTGAIGLLFAIIGSGIFTTVGVVMAIVASSAAILAGYYALRRRRFWWVIAGGTCALLLAPTLAYRGIPLGIVLPVAALVLIWLSRSEFR